MRHLILIIAMAPTLALANCPESNTYLSHTIINPTPSAYPSDDYYIQINVSYTDSTSAYLYVGWYNNNFSHTNSFTAKGWDAEQFFGSIPLDEYDSNENLRAIYRGYQNGNLIAHMNDGYNYVQNQPNVWDPDAIVGDDHTGCAPEPVSPGASFDELEPYINNALMLLGVIAFATCFLVGQRSWDLVLRAKDNPKFWVVFFLLALPATANAQGNVCHKVAIYDSHSISVNQNANGYSSVTLTINWSDSTQEVGTVVGNGNYSGYTTGNLYFSGIPYDIRVSDTQLRGLWNGITGNTALYTQLGTPGATVDLTAFPDVALVPCDCQQDPSFGGCSNYTPSGPDVPTYCSDGETEDESPDDPDCGCPGQDWTTCDDPNCEDSDGDLCCDEVDPNPDDADCGCDRNGPQGDCSGGCPECDKTLDEFADDFLALFEEYGVDLSIFDGRANDKSPLMFEIPFPDGGGFGSGTYFYFGSDESYMADGPMKTALGTVRSVFRNICLLFSVIMFAFAVLRVYLY